jgi:hypothetical protein
MKIEKCPFCDKDVAKISNCQELEGCRHFEKCPATEPYVCVVCNMFEGGCGASSGYYDSEAKAIAAWNRRAQPENEPLTLDELRGMVGEPVWMARAKKWVFVATVVTEPYAQVWYFFKGFVYAVLYYHEKFYRNKPERSEG